jgi:hypothetical protein
MFFKSGGLTPNNHDTARAALTYAILNSARTGERNPWKLAKDAVILVNAYQPAIQERQRAPGRAGRRQEDDHQRERLRNVFL